MQIKSFIVTLVAGSLAFASCNTFKTSKSDLKTLADSTAYAIGTQFGTQLNKGLPTAPGGKNLNHDIILAAFNEALRGKEPKIPLEKLQKVTESYFMKAQAVESTENLKAGKKFLDENAKKSGVKTTASGLQYEVIKEGNGSKPIPTDTVKVNYKGTTIEGKVFDSSEGKEPAKFPLNQVIPAWTEGLQLMTVGSKYKLYVPAALGYGERSMGTEIKPNSVLIFEVELLEIKK